MWLKFEVNNNKNYKDEKIVDNTVYSKKSKTGYLINFNYLVL